MKYKVIPTPEFIKNIKSLKKKYKSVKNDVLLLAQQLEADPKIGTELGHNTFKIRIKNSDNNKGKSGGYRVITYFVSEDGEVYLLTIYFKSDRESILDLEIEELLKSIFNSKKINEL